MNTRFDFISVGNTGKPSKKQKWRSLLWKFDHRVDWGNVAILDYNSYLRERLTLEACHFRRQSFPLNRDQGVLPTEYDHLLKSSQQQTC